MIGLALVAAALLVGSACDLPWDGLRREDASAEAAQEAPTLPPPDPDGVTVYRWEDVHAAGRLEWAWAIASDHGDLDQIERLLDEGFDPDTLIGGDYASPSDSRRGLYRTALIEAAWLQYDDVAYRLLAVGADPTVHEMHYDDGNERGRGGDTALHKAAFRGNVELVRTLLEAGVPADVEGFDGRTALASAVNDLETFELLLERGASLEGAGGSTRLFDSTSTPEVAAYLLELGAEIEGEGGKREHGYTPLWSAVVQGREEMVLFLLDHGADPHVVPSSGDLIDLARKGGHGDVVTLLERARAGLPLRPPAEAPPGGG